jgi:hypothetical protein
MQLQLLGLISEWLWQLLVASHALEAPALWQKCHKACCKAAIIVVKLSVCRNEGKRLGVHPGNRWDVGAMTGNLRPLVS